MTLHLLHWFLDEKGPHDIETRLFARIAQEKVGLVFFSAALLYFVFKTLSSTLPFANSLALSGTTTLNHWHEKSSISSLRNYSLYYRYYVRRKNRGINGGIKLNDDNQYKSYMSDRRINV